MLSSTSSLKHLTRDPEYCVFADFAVNSTFSSFFLLNQYIVTYIQLYPLGSESLYIYYNHCISFQSTTLFLSFRVYIKLFYQGKYSKTVSNYVHGDQNRYFTQKPIFWLVIAGCSDCNQPHVPHHLILGYCRTVAAQQSGLPGREPAPPVDFEAYDRTLVLNVSADYLKT